MTAFRRSFSPPNQPQATLEASAVKVLEMFSPNLILGVSDEVPPTADIKRVKVVSQIVEDFDPRKRRED